MGHPRIDRILVSNFQSLDKADLELGPFTVIVGPSNSGKSAVLRAMRAVVRNVNSPSSVRVGKPSFMAMLSFDGTRVAIERGKSQSTYRVILPDESEEAYTKAGRSVPEEVQKLLGLPSPEGPDLTFSSQIDPPFLLSETGTTAAKMLGDLTNVSRLHAASREANRRRLEASKMVKIRKDDAQAVFQRLKDDFADLPSQRSVLGTCRDLMDSVQGKAREKERLEKTLSALEMVAAAEEDLQVRMEQLPQPADVEGLAEKAGALLGERHALLDVIDTLSQLTEQEATLLRGVDVLSREIENLEIDYTAALREHGECPTCGQAVA